MHFNLQITNFLLISFIFLAIVLYGIYKIFNEKIRRSRNQSKVNEHNILEERCLEEESLSVDLFEIAIQFKMLIKFTGEPFALPRIIDLAKKFDVYRPYSNLNSLLLTKVIVTDGKGYYKFSQKFNEILNG